jgi:iron complex outermembrane receptor protein
MYRLWYVVASLLSLAIVVLSSGPLLAQSTLPPVVVTAPPGGSADGSLDLEQEAEVGSRLGLKLKEQPASVEIIPGEVMRLWGDTTAQEAVTRSTGISAAGTPGDGLSAIASRGFVGNGSIMQLYDGTRLYVAAATLTFPVDTWLLDRVEVLRGPASVLHGVGAIGGAINYVPRSPLRSIRVTDVLFSAGRYDTYQLGFNTSGPISDHLAYQVGVIGTRSDGYVDDGDSRRVSTASSLVFDVTPEFTLRLAFDGSWNEPLRYFGTPLNNGAIDTRLRDRNYNVSDSLIRWEDYWVRLHAEWRLAPAVTLHNEMYYLTADRHWRNAENYTFRPDAGLVDRTSYIEVLHDQEQFGNRFEARFNGAVSQRPYRVVVGFDVNHITFRSTSNSPFPGDSTVDAFTPDPGVFIHDAPTLPRFDTNTTQFALFAEGILQLTKHLKFLAGLRFDYVDYSRDNLISPELSFDKTLDPLTWRVGGVFDLTRSLALYAQISSGTDPLGSLITLSLSESDFDLATAQQYEVGLKTQFLGGRGEATLAGYYIVKKDLLTTDPTNPDVTLQIGQQSSYGIEFAVGLTPPAAIDHQRQYGTIGRAVRRLYRGRRRRAGLA